ncbi:hypothetical protein H2198_005890 [Neophaeococcomyces mojaviensis]|uniref:Uncharacterized protein n=1 Tax=Neophaeococcomyces mojaviensis TaxID=3383035 RepID=A0ACC3A4W3_9EURO|nr:hypothetical protein H2198_005890 [Knufia sp. JES_112]
MLLTTTAWFSLLPCLTSAALHEHRLKHAQVHHDHKREITTRQSASTNGLMIQGFEWYVVKDSQHWNRLNGQLEKLAGIGIDRIWIPPATKANAYNSTGYDVYDLWDLGEFGQKGHVATSYGTKEELVALSDNATALGITLLADGVINQRSGADKATPCSAHKVNPTNRLESISSSQTISAWVDFTFPGRGGKYSNKTWTCDDFTGVDYDDTTKESAIWKIEADDNDFATDVSTENGNYDYLTLADVAYHNPSVQEDVKAWGSWVVEQLGLSGFRLDAAKHISRAFLLDWITSIKAQTGKSDLLFVAEYLTGDPAVVQSFADGLNNTVSVFDTPLQTKFHEFSTGDQMNLATVFDYTWLSTRPDQAVTYVMNHDTQVGQALESLNVQGWFLPLAYALILLREAGYPCLFYGDMYGTYNDNGAFTAPPYAKMIADLALARKYFAYGTQTDYLDSTNVVGWTRQGDSDHPEGLAVIMSNAQGGDQTKTMNVGTQHAGETWSSLFGGTGAVTISDDGTAEFIAGAGTVNMYTRADASQRSGFGSWDVSL